LDWLTSGGSPLKNGRRGKYGEADVLEGERGWLTTSSSKKKMEKLHPG